LRLHIPDGPLPTGTEEAVEAAWRAEAVLFVPELALVESAQVLHKKVRAEFITCEESDDILASLLDLPFEIVGHRSLLQNAVDVARRHLITVYDALFIALANDRCASLITADKKLAAAWREHAEKIDIL